MTGVQTCALPILGDNKFAIYTNNEYTLNVGYYAYENSARLLVEPKGALPTRAEDNKTEKKTTAQITMLDTNGGLSILIRLEDGRFIVIDGGYSENFGDFSRAIKQQASAYTDEPIIAAWIITHAHGDHVNLLFGQALAIKTSGITVESILLNQLSEAETARSYETTQAYQAGKVSGFYDFGQSEGITKSNAVIEEIAPAFGADLYKVHIGQSFNISNVRMDVLFTMEGDAPEVCNSYNGISNIIKMTFTDSETGDVTTFLSTGDATGRGMDVARRIFGDYMKCDILSVNHHGWSTKGGDSQMISAFKSVSPALLLWPVGYVDINTVSNLTYNRVLFENSSFKECHYAGNGDGSHVLVPLPYVEGNVSRIKY